jgi:hypothetical protein
MRSSSLFCVAAISAVWPALSQDLWTFTTAALDQKIAACCYRNYSTSETIEGRLKSASRSGTSPAHLTIYRSAATPFVNHVPPGTPLPAPPQLLSEVMNSALVVVGVPVAERSLPTRDHSFLFTEYAVRVDRVYYAGSTNVSAGQEIIVSAPGGIVVVNGVRVEAVEPDLDGIPLQERQIFSLRSVPASDAYFAIPSGTYHLRNGRVLPASRMEAALQMQEEAFLILVQTAVDFRTRSHP